MARKTTDIGQMFESLIDDLQIQVAASVDGNLSELSRRIAKIERRLDQLLPNDESLSQKQRLDLNAVPSATAPHWPAAFAVRTINNGGTANVSSRARIGGQS